MTLSLLSNSSDRIPVALASPPCAARTHRSSGCWAAHGYAAAPRLRREKPHDLASLPRGVPLTSLGCRESITRLVLGTVHPPSPDPSWAPTGATAVPAPSRTGTPSVSPPG